MNRNGAMVGFGCASASASTAGWVAVVPAITAVGVGPVSFVLGGVAVGAQEVRKNIIVRKIKSILSLRGELRCFASKPDEAISRSTRGLLRSARNDIVILME